MENNNNIYVIITCSLINANSELRQKQYLEGISQTIKVFKDIPKCQLIIVENTGRHESFLDKFGIPVIYTINNYLNYTNKGVKEIKDVFDVINYLNVKDDDFIIKVTGRYFIQDNSKFISELKQINEKKYDAITRFGTYRDIKLVSMQKLDWCYTGLIGLRCKYVKNIEIPAPDIDIEIKWAKEINKLPYDKICILDSLSMIAYVGSGTSEPWII